MLHLRSARAAAEHYKSQDPDSCISETYIRYLIDNGEIPVVQSGVKKMISLEALDAYLNEKLGVQSVTE